MDLEANFLARLSDSERTFALATHTMLTRIQTKQRDLKTQPTPSRLALEQRHKAKAV
jgi:hypothetical protein